MKDIKIIAPIKNPDDIESFVRNSKCRIFYVYHHKFLPENFEYIKQFIEIAHKYDSQIYVNFKHDIKEDNLPEIKNFINFLKKTKIDGVFINSFAILEVIKQYSLPFKLMVDSYFDIHNLSGIDFVSNFHKIDLLNITEEIYMKNIAKIKKYTNLKLAIDSDNIPWCAEDIKKLNAIDTVIIKGKFTNSEEILDGINLVEKILEKPKLFKNQKLPFKHVRKSIYQTNHFSGEMVSAQGRDFKFRANIKKFEWEHKIPRLKSDFDYKSLNIPRINLRLSSVCQLTQLQKYIKKIGFNPIYSIEYGEILSTADLAKSSFNELMYTIKDFCNQNNIRLNMSTPRILIERDFDRVFEYVKQVCTDNNPPASVIINNIGYFWSFINDQDLERFPIEIGSGINLLNSSSIKCLNNLHPIEAIDFSSFKDIKNIQGCIKKVKNIIPTKKLTIAGNVRIPSLGLCPLNNDSAIISRLSCKAPCHKGNYALKDPYLKEIRPFVVDGFCRMHMYKAKILHLYKNIPQYQAIGINEFILDLSSLNHKFIPIMLTNLLNSIAGFSAPFDTCNNEYEIENT